MFYISNSYRAIETKGPLHSIDILFCQAKGTLRQFLSTNLYLNYKNPDWNPDSPNYKKKCSAIIQDPYISRIAAQIQILNDNPDCKVTDQQHKCCSIKRVEDLEKLQSLRGEHVPAPPNLLDVKPVHVLPNITKQYKPVRDQMIHLILTFDNVT